MCPLSLQAVDFSFPYWEEASGALYQIHGKEPSIFSFFWPFHMYVWLVFILFWFMVAASLWLINKVTVELEETERQRQELEEDNRQRAQVQCRQCPVHGRQGHGERRQKVKRYWAWWFFCLTASLAQGKDLVHQTKHQ